MAKKKPAAPPPAVHSEDAYNPLAKKHLGESVTNALLFRPVEPMPPANPFMGAGLYAIYYLGKSPLYERIAKANKENFSQPIYVGKAVPAGARKGGYGLEESPGSVLFSRLREHADSISATPTLRLADFRCRYLVVDDIWIPLGESLLIATFQPLWNLAIDGFGNHDPGAGRYNQKRSPWDELHPGRDWAKRLQPASHPPDRIAEKVREFLAEPTDDNG